MSETGERTEVWENIEAWKVFVDIESSGITEVDWEPISEVVMEAMEAAFEAGLNRIRERLQPLYPQVRVCMRESGIG